MSFRRILTILLVFVWSMLASVSYGETVSCSHHEEHSHSSPLHVENDDTELSENPFSADEQGGEAPSQHCECTSHRVHCCNSLNVLVKAARFTIEHSLHEGSFQTLLFNVKAAPFLEGPFQPPRQS